VDVEVETEIARPRETVAGYLFDWRNDTAWIGGISEARRIDGGDFGVGVRVARVARFLGKRIEYVNEVVELDPGHRLVMRSVQGPFPMRITYEVDDADGGTRVRLRNEGDASRAYRLAGPLLARAVRRATQRDLDRLKRILESVE
jgi:carbon monoxide dehydrogenase subunit G